MGFIQIVDVQTSKFDEVRKTGDEWEQATAGRRTARRRVLCQDRDNPGRYYNIVFFDSFESAMENSSLPETQALSEKLMSYAEKPPSFVNLDVIEDRAL
ncbi:MAG TPA: hypothetical protein VLZ77_03660 [Acidimicrobiales bacterium]|nr:hypothetical protein [Acidimicrobiales bacterium]